MADRPTIDELRGACRKRWNASGFTTRVVAVNGVELHVAEAGSGKPLVLLHGYPQSGEIWRTIAPRLAERRRVLIPDLRGMGLSTIAADGYDLPNLAEDLHQLSRALAVSSAEVVGHDWGAAVAAAYALRYRAVSRLVFIESALAGAGFESLWSFAQPNPAMTFIPLLLSDGLAEGLISGREEAFLHHLWRTFTANTERCPFDSWAPYVAAMKRPGLIGSSAGYYRAVYGAIDAVRELMAVGKLAIPVLSVAGGASFGAGQRALVEAFADNIVKHVVIDDAGHFVAEEQPEALLAELDLFLDFSANPSA